MTITVSSSRLIHATVAVTALLFLVKASLLCATAFATDAPTARPAAATPSSPTPIPAVPAGSAIAPGTGNMEAAGTSDVGAVQTRPVPDYSIVQELDEERAKVAAREAAVRAREAALSATSAEVDRRIAELHTLLDRQRVEEAAERTRTEDQWMKLVRTYEAMRPTNAAAIFDVLDLRVLVPVLDRMQERRSALILASMQPERARLATQQLAQIRTAANSPPIQAVSAGSGLVDR